MMTLPLETGMDSTNDVRIQPIPGSTAPLTERVAQAPSTQVARMTAQQTSAATGTGPAARLYWKLPISPCTAPNRNSTPYMPTETGHCGSRLRVDRKSTRLNSSHEWISYAVFCLKKKKQDRSTPDPGPHATYRAAPQ